MKHLKLTLLSMCILIVGLNGQNPVNTPDNATSLDDLINSVFQSPTSNVGAPTQTGTGAGPIGNLFGAPVQQPSQPSVPAGNPDTQTQVGAGGTGAAPIGDIFGVSPQQPSQPSAPVENPGTQTQAGTGGTGAAPIGDVFGFPPQQPSQSSDPVGWNPGAQDANTFYDPYGAQPQEPSQPQGSFGNPGAQVEGCRGYCLPYYYCADHDILSAGDNDPCPGEYDLCCATYNNYNPSGY